MLRSRPLSVFTPRGVITALLLTALVGCGGGETGPLPPPPPPPPPPSTPASIAITAGDEQEAAAGTAVAVPPAVVVRNSEGQPLASISVQFAVAEGGGSVQGASATTDASGVARVTGWTLGESGAQRLTAQAGSLAAISFRATITPGTETIITSIGPTGGTVQITTDGHPLKGLSVTVPAGSFPVPGTLSLRIAAGATAPALPTGYRVTGPILEVHTTARRSARLMTVQVPVTRADNEDIVLVFHDPVRRVTEVLPTIARGATSVTAMTAHLRADLLLGPESVSSLRAAVAGSLPAGETGWLMPVAFALPQPEVILALTRWPVLDHGSALLPNGFGPGIPALLALGAARNVESFFGQIKPLATPGFYAEAAPLAAASMAQTTLEPQVASVFSQLQAGIQPLAKTLRDEMWHRNTVASLALSLRPTVAALVTDAQGGQVIYGNVVSGTETSIGVAPPAHSGLATMVRNAVSGYAQVLIPLTPDQPTVSVESAAPLSSFVVPFEDISTTLTGLVDALGSPARSAERKAKNRTMAQLAGLLQPILEVEAAPGKGWHAPGDGPIAIRTPSARLRSVDNNPASLAVHDEEGEVVVMAEAVPVDAELVVMVMTVAQPKEVTFSGFDGPITRRRQTVPVEGQLVWVPFQLVPDRFDLKFGEKEVTFDAAVPYPPEGGYRIRWNWGDNTTSEVVNDIRGVHEYAEPKDVEVIATLLPGTGEAMLAVDTVRVSTGQPFWKITSLRDPDEFYSNPPEPAETDDILFRAMTPGVGLIALVAVPGGRELRLYAKAAGVWESEDCCPPTIVPADEWLLLGQDPEFIHSDLGPFWSAWRSSRLIVREVSQGTWTGHTIGPKRSFVVKDAGTQIGTEYALEFTLRADGTSAEGVLRLTIWGMNEDNEVEQDSEQTFRFTFDAVRLR